MRSDLLSQLRNDLFFVEQQMLLLGNFVFINFFESLLVCVGHLSQLDLETLLFFGKISSKLRNFLMKIGNVLVALGKLTAVCCTHLCDFSVKVGDFLSAGIKQRLKANNLVFELGDLLMVNL